MATKRPAQGRNSTKPVERRKVSPDKVRTNAAPRASNNKRKRVYG